MIMSHSAQRVDYLVLSGGAGLVDVQDRDSGGDDVADAPRVQADVAQGPEGHLEEGVAALADGSDAVVGLVERLLDVGELTVAALLERHGDGVGLALVAEVAEGT